MALTKITPQMFDTSAAGHDFNIDNGTFVVDASANRVGIGTTTPSTLLDVNGVLTATSIVGTLTTAAQTNITSVGTLSSLSVGNITSTGTIASGGNITVGGSNNLIINDSGAAVFGNDGDITIGNSGANGLMTAPNGNFTLDVANDIILDSDNGVWRFKDAGTSMLEVSRDGSSHLVFYSAASNMAMQFKGNDGGSTVTALTLDMQNAGEATFNAGVRLGDGHAAQFGASQDLLVYHSSNENIIQANTSDQHLLFKGNDGGSTITALTLDMSNAGRANFNGNVGIGGFPDSDSGLHLKGDGRRILIDSTDYNLVSLGRRGSSGSGLDKAYFRMKSAGTNTVVIDTDGSSYFNGGNVGIGTTNPLSPLSVQADTGAAAMRFIGRSSDNIASVGFFNSAQSADTYLQSNGSWIRSRAGSGFHFARNTTPAVTDTDGFTVQDMNLGVGTSSPGHRLHVLGDSSNQTAVTKIQRVQASASNNTYTFEVDSSAHTSNMTSSGAMKVDVNSGRAFTINGLGNVGLGTSSPNGNGILTLNTPTDNSPQIVFSENDTGKWLIGHRHDGDHFRFYDLANSAERMRINDAGNVRIGSGDPLHSLHISNKSGQAHNGIRIDNTTSYYAQLNFYTTGGNRRGFVQSAGNGNLEIGTDSNSANLQLFAGGQLGLEIHNTTRNIGVGVTPDTSASGYKFKVYSGDYLTMKLRAPTYPTLRFEAINQNSGNNASIGVGASNSVNINPNNTTVGLSIDNTGIVTAPNQPYVQGRGNGGWSAYSSSSAWELQPHGNSPVTSRDHNSDYSTTNRRFTCPVDGVYLVMASWYIYQTAATTAGGQYVHPALYRNGVLAWNNSMQPYTIYGHEMNRSGTGSKHYDGIQMSYTIYCSANDYLDIRVYTPNSNTQSYENYHYFSYTLLS